ncbi:unnamed protein product [Enterobius vermicularis]|uniref:Gluconokinase n=1 Tax=Enterobius vermicularis TaxID=51028 RepID=A0A0N4V2C8_ENTVE|nr:unnamed protein product [Enterobius vermicularis]
MTKLDCIFVMGVSGCGKTTVGQKLAETLNAKFTDADDYHSIENRLKMANGIALKDEDRYPWLQKIAEIAANSTDQVVIACSSLKFIYRQMLSSNLSKNKYIFLYLDVERNQLEERLKNRKGHFVDQRLLDSQLATLELVDNESNFYTVNGNHSVEDTVKDSMAIINSLHPISC